MSIVYVGLILLFNISTDYPTRPRGPLRISSATRDNATFQWETPDSVGSSPVTGYIIETKEISSDDWTFLGRTDSETTTLCILSLIEDCYYFFRVTAENQFGRGIPLESDVPVEPSRLFGEYHYIW